MFAPTDFPKQASDRTLALASALVITGVLLATAIIPASPALAGTPIMTMGVLA